MSEMIPYISPLYRLAPNRAQSRAGTPYPSCALEPQQNMQPPLMLVITSQAQYPQAPAPLVPDVVRQPANWTSDINQPSMILQVGSQETVIDLSSFVQQHISVQQQLGMQSSLAKTLVPPVHPHGLRGSQRPLKPYGIKKASTLPSATPAMLAPKKIASNRR